ncbi:uncharacterized protein METZ01_LOCUS292599 [marine metagenome]|uniref:Uncharacterized protein n=1 Tax=marine metagenome TaxID=408172 RepID=A0A382LVK1_9ZZZZ
MNIFVGRLLFWYNFLHPFCARSLPTRLRFDCPVLWRRREGTGFGLSNHGWLPLRIRGRLPFGLPPLLGHSPATFVLVAHAGLCGSPFCGQLLYSLLQLPGRSVLRCLLEHLGNQRHDLFYVASTKLFLGRLRLLLMSPVEAFGLPAFLFLAPPSRDLFSFES